jgi:hypothetical protein
MLVSGLSRVFVTMSFNGLADMLENRKFSNPSVLASHGQLRLRAVSCPPKHQRERILSDQCKAKCSVDCCFDHSKRSIYRLLYSQ